MGPASAMGGNPEFIIEEARLERLDSAKDKCLASPMQRTSAPQFGASTFSALGASHDARLHPGRCSPTQFLCQQPSASEVIAVRPEQPSMALESKVQAVPAEKTRCGGVSTSCGRDYVSSFEKSLGDSISNIEVSRTFLSLPTTQKHSDSVSSAQMNLFSLPRSLDYFVNQSYLTPGHFMFEPRLCFDSDYQSKVKAVKSLYNFPKIPKTIIIPPSKSQTFRCPTTENDGKSIPANDKQWPKHQMNLPCTEIIQNYISHQYDAFNQPSQSLNESNKFYSILSPMSDSSPTDQSARCITDETGLDSSILSAESLQSLAMPTVHASNSFPHQLSNENKFSTVYSTENFFGSVSNYETCPSQRRKKSVKVSTTPEVGFYSQTSSASDLKRLKANNGSGSEKASLIGAPEAQNKDPRMRTAEEEGLELYDTTIDVETRAAVHRPSSKSTRSALGRILDSLPWFVKPSDRCRSSRSSLSTAPPAGDYSLSNSNEGLKPGSPLTGRASHAPLRRTGLVAIELPGLSKKKKKTSQVPMRRQLSRRVPRKDSQRHPRLSKSLSVSSSSTCAQLGAFQASIEPHRSLSGTQAQGLEGGRSPDGLSQSVHLPSAPEGSPRERNPLRRVSRMLTAAGPALVRKVSKLGTSRATEYTEENALSGAGESVQVNEVCRSVELKRTS